MNGNKVPLIGKKNITLVGMSGCGKTFLSQSLIKKGFFHYSADWEISTILRPQILQSVIEKIKNESPFFKSLHENFLIKTELSLTFDDLSTVTNFVIPLNEKNKVTYKNLITSQKIYKQAELQSMANFFRDAQSIMKNYKSSGIICDATGSIFEITLESPEIIEKLKNETQVVYIKTDENHKQTLIDRSKNAIKPILYNERFLNKNLQEYYSVKKIDDDFEIDGEFFPWVFANLLEYRTQCYEKLASQTNAIIINASNVQDFETLFGI